MNVSKQVLMRDKQASEGLEAGGGDERQVYISRLVDMNAGITLAGFVLIKHGIGNRFQALGVRS